MTEAYHLRRDPHPARQGQESGSLHEVKPINLLAGVLDELQQRHDLDTAQVDDVVMGWSRPSASRAAASPRPRRWRRAGTSAASGVQLNRFCASGLEAVNMAAQKVRSGWEDLVVAGGVETMSRVPLGSDRGAWARSGDQLGTAFIPQGISADLIATLEGFSREQVDAYAMRSQQRAGAARDGGPLQALGGAGGGFIGD